MAVKILIVKTSALGDIVQALPFIDYIKAKRPDAEIDWVVEKAGADLVRSHPLIRRTLVVDTMRWRKAPFACRHEISAFFKQLKSCRYDLLFDLQGNTKSAFWTFFAKAKYKIGFGCKSAREIPNLFVTNKKYNPKGQGNIVQRYLSVAQQFFQDEEEWTPPSCLLNIQGNLAESMPQSKVESGYKFMVCFGSRWENKKLSTEALKEFLRRVVQEDHIYVVYGGEAEKKEAELLVQGLGEKATLLAPMALPVWQNKMAEMDGVLAVDSVGLHLAGLARVPTFSFFGPSSSSVYQPQGQIHASLQGSCPYDVHFAKHCPKLRSCPSGACLKQITAEDLWLRFQEWRSKSQSRCVYRQDRQLP